MARAGIGVLSSYLPERLSPRPTRAQQPIYQEVYVGDFGGCKARAACLKREQSPPALDAGAICPHELQPLPNDCGGRID